MTTAWVPVAAAPLLMVFLVMYAVRPIGPAVAPLRLAAIRAALVVGSFAVVVVEATSALHALTPTVVGVVWLVGLAVAGVLALWRRRRGASDKPAANGALQSAARRATHRLRSGWGEAGRVDRALALTIVGLMLAELVVALLAEPNNYDSYTYHLTRIEKWVAQGSVEFFPTMIHRQITVPPGAEYLLTHLRLLTGSDATYHLLQWFAGIGCLAVATRVVAQFGGGRRAQLITAFLVATTPMVALQASSTQTDLITAAWVGCAASLVLDALGRWARVTDVLALGAATGLTAITKTNGLLGVAPMLVFWACAQLRLAWPTTRRIRTTFGASIAVLAVAAVLVAPFTARIAAEFGHPLGPPRLRESIPMQRHDPAAVVVNALRIGHTALDTPFAPLRDAQVTAIVALAEAIGVDAQDRRITFGQTLFPEPAWHPDEDRVSFPLAGGLCLIAVAFAVVAPRRLMARSPGALRAYAVAVIASGALYSTMIKWQPWGNRLLMFILVLAAPLAGLWLANLFERTRARRSIAAMTASAVLAAAALSGALAVSYGFPRRLIGTGSVFTTGDWETRFLRRPDWRAEYQWAALNVTAHGAERVGLVQQNNTWEYPWWLLLPGREIVALQSVLPKHPPPDPSSVDAIVCAGERSVCESLVPPTWLLEFGSYVGYAVPPEAPAGTGS